VMAANGSSPRQLTDTPQPDFRGYVTVAGNTVVYPTRGENGDRLIELSLEDGSRRVIARSAGSLFHPTQSPLDGPILVGVQRGERRSLIGMVADVGPGKGTVVPITDPPPGQVDGSPSWASSGSDVAFIRSDRETGDGAIVILSYMSGDETEVLRVDHPSSVAWSPDGGRLVYSARGPSGDLDLYVLDLETMKIIPLVERAGDDDLPAWSPDGRFVAFNHVDGDTIAVFVVRDDGTGIVRLPTGSDHDAAPVWFAPSE
jgi:Tol biopolymer transport system component